MCRLFGMSGGNEPVRSTFWLLEAPDSLAQQSRREPDGTGLGWFDADGTPEISKQPLAAYEDHKFAQEAKEVESRTFVAHVRYASTGGLTTENTHPFELDSRLFAHNGVIAGLDELDAQLGDDRQLVRGETDSERFFALITREARRTGDVGEAIASSVAWIADHLPVYALNFVLISDTDLWAFRYPETHDLYMLERAAGGGSGHRHLDHASARGSVRVRSAALADRPAVIVATEEMDEAAGWRPLESGQLLHVDGSLGATVATILDRPPAHLLSLADLDPRAAASQSPSK
jgi:predicted glutamine amidotransferase